MSNTTYDAIVVGARCAGSATAMLLARAGLKVLLVERAKAPGDTLSTHALMRPAVGLLRNWGLLDAVAAVTSVVRQTQFIYGDERLVVPIKAVPGIDGLYAPRRYLLDEILRDAAVASGAELRLGTACTRLAKDQDGRVVGASLKSAGKTVTVRADSVIGADGRSSSVAKFASAPLLASSDHRTAVYYTYLDGIPNEGYRWYYTDTSYAGLIPTSNGQHCLFAGCAPERFADIFSTDRFGGMMNVLARWEPALTEFLRARGPTERLRGFQGAPGFIRQSSGPGWALVGDAGYFKDPATAHGITDAFLDAQRLSDAIVTGSPELSAYADARDEGAQTFFAITQRKASFTSSLDALKSLHLQANACMKAEMAEVDLHGGTRPLAA
ncbi:MAG: NAD(P)/FAD-dependent oxidoreductase [Pseudomonadota bacterium]